MDTKNECHIKDSGARTKFSTGAVRDRRYGKGRCDLLPLGTCKYLMGYSLKYVPDEKTSILNEFDLFRADGNYEHFSNALMLWCIEKYGECNKKNMAELFLELAKHLEEGAKKYGENNWQKGFPISVYLDSAIRHYLKVVAEWDDEPHERAFVWNLVCGIWTMIKLPDMNDIKKKAEEEKSK